MQGNRGHESSVRRLVVRREHKANVTASELLVDRREAVQLVLERGGVLRVQVALDQAAPVSSNTRALAGDLRGINKVLKDRLVHGGERARVRAGLLVTVLSAGLAEDAALADKDNVAVRELLLKLTGETAKHQAKTRIEVSILALPFYGAKRIESQQQQQDDHNRGEEAASPRHRVSSVLSDSFGIWTIRLPSMPSNSSCLRSI